MAYTVSLCMGSVLLVIFYAYFYFQRRASKQNFHINWPVFGMLPGLLTNVHRLHDYFIECLEASGQGTVMFKGPWFLGMTFILTGNPDNVNYILNINSPNYHKGKEFVEIFDVFGDGIFGANSDSWRFQRTMAHNILSSQKYLVVQSTCKKMENVLLPLLKQLASNKKRVDLQEVLMRFVVEVAFINAFGIDFHYLASDFPVIPFAKAMQDVEVTILHRHMVPMTWWKLLRYLKLGKEKKIAKAKEVIDRFIYEQISKKREKMREPKRHYSQTDKAQDDLLSIYMAHITKIEAVFPESDVFLRDTLFTLLNAGINTNAIALAWFFWAVSKNPGVEQKIVDELREHACKNKKLDSNDMTMFNLQDIEDLVYLHAALCESLRLFAPVPFNHKEAIKHDTLPTGQSVHPGCTILIPMHSMGRMREIWGEDCLEFKPERWISEGRKIRQEPSYKFNSFGSGPRACLGKNIALTQMKLVTSSLIYNFKIQAIEDIVVEPMLSILLQMKNGLIVNLVKRNGDS